MPFPFEATDLSMTPPQSPHFTLPFTSFDAGTCARNSAASPNAIGGVPLLQQSWESNGMPTILPSSSITEGTHGASVSAGAGVWEEEEGVGADVRLLCPSRASTECSEHHSQTEGNVAAGQGRRRGARGKGRKKKLRCAALSPTFDATHSSPLGYHPSILSYCSVPSPRGLIVSAGYRHNPYSITEGPIVQLRPHSQDDGSSALEFCMRASGITDEAECRARFPYLTGTIPFPPRPTVPPQYPRDVARVKCCYDAQHPHKACLMAVGACFHAHADDGACGGWNTQSHFANAPCQYGVDCTQGHSSAARRAGFGADEKRAYEAFVEKVRAFHVARTLYARAVRAANREGDYMHMYLQRIAEAHRRI